MIEYNRKELGQYLKDCRQKSGLTQGEVSNRLGYSSPQFVSNIERGTSVAPIPMLARLMRLYKSNPDDIVEIILRTQKLIVRKGLKAKR